MCLLLIHYDKSMDAIVIDENAICYGIIYNNIRNSALAENVGIQRFVILYKRCTHWNY